MEDRLSPLSYDSGLHSLSAPSSPQKNFERPPSRQRESDTKLDGEPNMKRPRKEDDACVPASRESSEDVLSSDDTTVRQKIVEAKKQIFCQPSVSSQVSEINEPMRKKTKSVTDQSEEDERESEGKDTRETTTLSQDDSTKWKNRQACMWSDCREVYPNIDLLYDHVQETHIKEVMERENANAEEEELECLWGDCPMSIVRGDWSKKVKWLEQHYKTRHAKYAQTVKCVIDNCKYRCSSLGKLDDHVRKIHIQSKSESDNVEQPKRETERDKEELPPPMIIMQDEFAWDDYYAKVIVERNLKKVKLGGNYEWRLKPRQGKGAIRRKMRTPYVGDYVPISPKEEVKIPLNDEDMNIDYSKTLEDLFPGWGHKSLDLSIADKLLGYLEEKEPADIMDDIPVLTRVSPIPPQKSVDDSLPLIDIVPDPSLSIFSEEDSHDCDALSMPSLDRYPSDIEQDCLKCLEIILDTLS